MLRSFLESATRGWKLRRTLPVGERRVPIIVSPSCGLRFLFRPLARADPQLVGLALRYVSEGDTVWDVGANAGLFSLAAAAIAGPAGRVYAFEPDPWLAQLLRESASLQDSRSAPVEVIPAAVAQGNAIRSFHLARRSRASNHLAEYGQSQTGGTLAVHSVVAIALDWAAATLRPPRVLKIDVEGAEAEAIRGGMALIASARPVVLCEVSSAGRAEVTRMLASLGYRFIDGESGRECADAPWATIALPT
jgi:FkbM family methyltransferase